MEMMTQGQTAVGWTVDDSEFGARLALVRLRMDWNLKEAAKECGLPAASWRTWERDSVAPRRIVEVAKLVSKRTGCDFLWLLTGSSAPTGKSLHLSTRTLPTATPTRPPTRHDSRHPRAAATAGRRPALVGARSA